MKLLYKATLDKDIQKLSKKQKIELNQFVERFDSEEMKEWIMKLRKISIEVEKLWDDFLITNIEKKYGDRKIWLLHRLIPSIVIVFVGSLFAINLSNKLKPSTPVVDDIDSLLSWFIYTWNDDSSWTNQDIVSSKNKYDYEKYLSYPEKYNFYLPTNPVYSSFDPSNIASNEQTILNIRNKYSKYIQPAHWSINSGYLYVVASVNNWTLSEKESIYLYLWNYWWHLYKRDSLQIPSDDWKTHLLYPLDKIAFAQLPPRGYDDNKDMWPAIEKDWQELLNTSQYNLYFFWFVSTSRQWKLEEVTIAYE